MKRKIFLRFFLVTLASTLLMFIFGFIAVSNNAEAVVKERLIEETKIVALVLDDSSDFEKFKAYEGNDKFRITIFDTDANVILESDTSEALGNHSDRIEVQKALAGTPEAVKRYSETFECEMTYYAMKVTLTDGSIVVLRLAIRSSEVSSYLHLTLPLFVLVLIIALVLSIIISHFISLNISSKIDDVGKSLKSLNSGKYAPIKADESEPELFSVLEEINELNESIHSHITEVEREHKRLERVLEGISQGIIAVNDKREIIFVNKSALAIFEAKGNLVGKELICLINEPSMYRKIAQHIFEDSAFEVEWNNKYLSIVIHEVAKDDLKISSIVIITDITPEKAVAKQKSEFFANASHELKTPVTVMQGLSELMLADPSLDSTAAARTQRIHKESVRLASLISDMLKLSRLESGESEELTYTCVNVRGCFEEAIEELNEKIKEKGLTYQINGDGEISADPKKIYEIAQNLCSNAVNYNKENGSITVDISDTGDTVVLKVSDTGIGIEEKHIPHLCQRFYRVDKSHSKKTGGTGLGLAIVKHICALYGATLSIESELGAGTSITVQFKK